MQSIMQYCCPESLGTKAGFTHSMGLRGTGAQLMPAITFGGGI